MTDRYGVFSKGNRIAIAYVQPTTDGGAQFTVCVWPLNHKGDESTGEPIIEFVPHANSIFLPFTDQTQQAQAVQEAVSKVLREPRHIDLLLVQRL